LIPAPTATWSGPDSLAEILLIEGDRGTGKTAALVQTLNRLLAEGVEPARIQVLCGHRLYHRREFLTRMAEALSFPLAPLQVFTFPQWLRQFFAACPDPLGQDPLLITANDTLLLMQGFFQTHGYFQGHPLDRAFFRHVLNRHRARAINAWSWPEFEARSAALESEPLVPEIHTFLKDFQSWLLDREHPLLDYPLQWEYLAKRLSTPPVQKWLANFSHWLIDDLDETSPAEQVLIEYLTHHSTQLICTANPFGGAEQVLGAFPEYVQSLSGRAEIQSLPDRHPQAALASRLYKLCLDQALDPPEKAQSPALLRLKNSSAMLASLEMHLRKRLSAGVPPGELVLVSWALSDAFCLEVETMMAHMGVAVEIYRGSRVIQRNPLVSVLLALMRLVFWEQNNTATMTVPKLKGFEMAQIFALCLSIPPFELARLRRRFQDRLSDWGQYLQGQTSPLAEKLRETVADLRVQLSQQQIPLSQAAIQLWQKLLLPHLQPAAFPQVGGVTELIQRLSRWEQVGHVVEQPEALFLNALFSGEIREAGDPVQAPAEQAIKLMTLHRLCELHMESDYQFWLDLSHPAWTLQSPHPLNQRLIFSRSWPQDQPWSLEAEEAAGERHLAKMLRKGLRYCRRESTFFAADYDSLSQRQGQETLLRFLGQNFN